LEEEGEVIICLISNVITNYAGSFYNILHRYSEETVVSDKENDSALTGTSFCGPFNLTYLYPMDYISASLEVSPLFSPDCAQSSAQWAI
jgi:hypothetical protein